MDSLLKLTQQYIYFLQCTSFLPPAPPPGMDPEIRCHEMELNPTGYLWSEYESPLIKSFQDIDF